MNTLAVGVQSKGIVYDSDPLEGFEMMKRAGFSCCNFSLDSYFTNLSFSSPKNNDLFQHSVQELKNFFTPHKEAAETAGIKISQICMPCLIYMSSAAKERINDLIQTIAVKSMEICAFFGCPHIVVYGFDAVGGSEAEWEWTEKFLDLLAPMAKDLKITMCIENCIMKGFYRDAGRVAAYIDCINEKYGAEVMGFCFDTGHANLLGIAPEDFIMTLGSRLKVLYIHDNDGIRDLHQIPFTYSGDCVNVSSTDWDGVIRGLRKIQFDKVLSFETASALSAFPGKMKQDVLRFVSQIGSYFVGEIQNSRATYSI